MTQTLRYGTLKSSDTIKGVVSFFCNSGSCRSPKSKCLTLSISTKSDVRILKNVVFLHISILWCLSFIGFNKSRISNWWLSQFWQHPTFAALSSIAFYKYRNSKCWVLSTPTIFETRDFERFCVWYIPKRAAVLNTTFRSLRVRPTTDLWIRWKSTAVGKNNRNPRSPEQ